MDSLADTLTRVLSGPEMADLKCVEAKAALKAHKGKIAAFFAAHKGRVVEILATASNIDQQVSLARAVTLAVPRRQIAEMQLFGAGTAAILGRGKLDIKELLLRFNRSGSRHVVGCRVARLVSYFKPLTLAGGVLFMNEDSIKVYGPGHTIVIFYRSVEAMAKIDRNTWEVNARDNKRVVIELVEDEDYRRVEERILAMYPPDGMETEDSITLSIEDYKSDKLVNEREMERLFEYKENNAGDGTNNGIFDRTDSEEKGNRANTVENSLFGDASNKITEKKNDDVSPNKDIADSKDDKNKPDIYRSSRTTKDSIPIKKVTFSTASNTLHVLPGNQNFTASTLSSSSTESDHSMIRAGTNTAEQPPLGTRPSGQRHKKLKNIPQSFFTSVPILDKKFIKKVMKIYKTRLNYNKSIYAEMNGQARAFKDKMLEISKCKSHVLKKN